MELQQKFEKAAEAIKNSTAIIITAGAGMGVDSGLPDFRGDKGFWKAYPMYKKLGINFVNAANPTHFNQDPAFGWGFYGHRLNLYRKTIPHEGFNLILQWIKRYNLDYFIVTSNVDGQFQKAGFPEEKVCEVHGSIHYLQCTKPCNADIWGNNEIIEINYENMRAEYLPKCPNCGEVARPNILMFGDFSWISNRTMDQEKNFSKFLQSHQKDKIVVIEIGAGTAVPTIRNLTEQLGKQFNTKIIRINPREYQIAPPHISLACGGLEGLQEIDKILNS
ncbi:MAG: hypothetical protein PWP31_1607 [Clostridia bacterium]|nr:hypothetical protein [Clostridia bacterium]